ncbi:putative bifunctional diguanylate cyclase/phosphodiesterase [Imhoffiella purpurea]|uniref:Diguanylate cyclase n=1 Tax=Imhoffiella purpurea TaxID=1249627 RepID=W9VIJ6_9GAMM|nr:bifunctional diguanylate cyclase/phosphodiesterase [Imhoffiella purpurea]EXJ15867.1 diguanylate cyclase [Imhoffiella purpurea]
MNLALHPRLLSPADSPGEHSQSTPINVYPFAFDILREAIGRFPACRTLGELFSALSHCARLLLPSAQTAILLRQPDACFELVFSAPISARGHLRNLSERLIDSGGFAQAVRQGGHCIEALEDEACLLHTIATPRHIYGMAIWVAKDIPALLRQPLGALVDIAALSLDRLQGGAESFLLSGGPETHNGGACTLLDDIAIPADQLTGLAHRTHFIQFLQKVLLDGTPNTAVGIILLDVDGFHRVNREFGCETGDRLLRDVALRLDTALRSQFVYDTIGAAECDLCFARTGADEFGLAVARMRHPQRLAEIATHLHSHVSEGFVQQDTKLYLSISIGLATSHAISGAVSAQSLLRSADSALKRAKLGGRNQHVVYESIWDEAGSPHLRTESLLQEALRKDQFALYLQPLFRLDDMALVGAEVLLRLRISDGIPLPPSSFIPVAESTGQIVEIGEWVLRRACHQIRDWNLRGFPPIALSINVSAIELSRTDLSTRIRHIAEQEGVPPERLHIEITETAIARNEEQALINLEALRAAGFEIWIDDFGTGYSSLKSIKHFPISGLKLDREFVHDLAQNPATQVIASSILSMARNLGYPVVAEGIENADQFEFLRQQGCDRGQGFHLGRPVCIQVFENRFFPARPQDEGSEN